ncbi:hypothetical protein [Mycolicibacterium phlei]|uniref:hypothetical protein n=1 Tax=Mycolicibacterium phlei TaxID=1771 RepID=UPI0002DCD288|nr:hypothetical protein [Mycolicibacterium phlei]MBF4194593.1 hypothetical protein [Mycolicibacterium phlei]
MSLSKPREISPTRRFFRIRGATGDVVYYDKAKQDEVAVELPFRFIVLDVLNTIGGFHEPSNSGIWSNEVRYVDELFTVRTRDGVFARGTWEEIRDKVKGAGGKFGNSVYLAYKDENGEWAQGNLHLIGAAVSNFFDFKKTRLFDQDPGVAITGFTQQKKGRNEYFVPNFEGWDVPAEDLLVATKMDEALQVWLENRGNRDNDSQPSAPEPAPAPRPTAFPQQQTLGGGNLDAEPPF